MINAYKVMIIKLSSCVNLESKILEELNTCLATLSDIMVLIGDKIQNIRWIPSLIIRIKITVL